MREAREVAEWDRVAVMCAIMATGYSGGKKTFDPADFNPYRAKKKDKVQKVTVEQGMDLLKRVFIRNSPE